MRIAVTGRFGQVAQCLREKAAERPDLTLTMLGRPELDLADPNGVRAAICKARPDIVVSTAAYTTVDQAEDEPELAFAINSIGAEAVSEAARTCGAPVIHLSTDYVFAGDAVDAYSEDDPPSPCSVYGKSKLEGERLVARANPQHVILRTAWVYSTFGRNFVKTMLQLAKERGSVSVVADQWGNPTSAGDLADAILRIAGRLRTDDVAAFGTYHVAGADDTNWSGLARAVFETSKELGGPSAQVIDIPARDFPVKAPRPHNSRLSCEKLRATFRFTLPGFRRALRPVVERLVKQQPEK